ncbi:8042_t:CDS:2 [Gigaspora rosea]|nr:8042_t:CDS:2 [Gigaspora rosea]
MYPELQDFLYRRVESMLGNLENVRNQAQENVKKAQNKQKAYHDNKYWIETYQIGDKVLLHETSLKITIRSASNNKPQKSERVLKKRIHGDRLKRYIEAPVTMGFDSYKYPDD